MVTFGVLGPVAAWDAAADAIALKGPRHRAVLARLIAARRRVVPVGLLVEDLWAGDPPPGAVNAVRTFVAALRRALEPERAPRTPARLLVTEGPGYALRAGRDAVDAWRFEDAVAEAAALPPVRALARLEEALGWWRGPAYAEFAEEAWARAERSRLGELRLQAVERLAGARLALGRTAEAVPDLDAHVAEHPWREDAWRLLALALYRTGRQGDALAVLRRARTLLAEQLGLDPGPELRRLENDILRRADHLDARQPGAATEPERVWSAAASAYDRTVASGARARLESTVGLLRSLAVTGGGGGLLESRRQRVAAVGAAEELGDAELTARVIGAYDVPAVWTRADDPEQAARIVAAARRTLADLPPGTHEAARARLLATVAVESRGMPAYEDEDEDQAGSADGPGAAARESERIARRLDDPALLAFALNGTFMQTFHRAGLAPERDAIGAELVALSARNGLTTYEVLGHLVRLQARSALADFASADRHAADADRLAERHELPLVGVFTRWYGALRLAAAEDTPLPAAEAAYRDAAALLDGAGMPGLERGLLPLALLCLRLRHGLPAQTGHRTGEETDWGPYEPWARPHVLLARDRRTEAAAALRTLPEPPRDLLYEAMWCLAVRAAREVGDEATLRRAHAELAPAAGELAGAGSGLLTLGPVADHLPPGP
ncbi:SARP family transcriptional regulator [Streptomyces armeniacus]|uniref:SARP family transcriptional regulator n=1 Tax=Streptomyces armeniacus TaxID=83291 RepID=A0A345Y1S2_9ACTN|nr:BTAD domain-containing putative transcriptional regulator [Streptomyces armeniacus]AXK37838.1 SARP family transcriptional regulator [Streptomyces armeniacus]